MNNKKHPSSRFHSLLFGAICAGLILCIIVIPQYLFFNYLSFMGVFVGSLWLAPSLFLYYLIVSPIASRMHVRRPRLSSLLIACGSLLMGVFCNMQTSLKLEVTPLLADCVVICVSAMVISLSMAQMSRIKSHYVWPYVVCLLCMVFLGGGVQLANYTAYASQRQSYLDRANAVTFPVYYPNSVSIQPIISFHNDYDGRPSVTFMNLPYPFSESKYPGMNPSEACGNSYGAGGLELSAQCREIYKGKEYILYRRIETYPTPKGAPSYGYFYFAIYHNQTVVWFNLDGSRKATVTNMPLEDVLRFYDSLVPTSIHSRTITKALLAHSD